MHCLIEPADGEPVPAGLDVLLQSARELPLPDPDPLDPHSPAERTLGEAAGLPADAALPLAAWTLGDTTQCWSFVSPVHVRLEASQALALPQAALDLSEAESRALFDTLAELFPDAEGWQRRWLDAGTWALAHEQLDGLRLASLSRAVDRPLTPWLPDDRRLRRWTNEVQMLWHGHAVNAARPLAVNSIWWWGAGRAPGAAPAVLRVARGQAVPAGCTLLTVAGPERARRFALGARRWWQRRGPSAAEVWTAR